MYPLQFTRLLGLVDVEVLVDAGGPSSQVKKIFVKNIKIYFNYSKFVSKNLQAGAIRYALSMSLRSFVDEETLEEMKICGLLTQDVRVRERKKPGQEGARRKFHWRKR